MPKFRKKSVVIEAIQYDGTDDGYRAVVDFKPDARFEQGEFVRPDGKLFMGPGRSEKRVLNILVPGAWWLAYPGDWIIRDKLYPCKAHIFGETYEPVEEEVRASHPGRSYTHAGKRYTHAELINIADAWMGHKGPGMDEIVVGGWQRIVPLLKAAPTLLAACQDACELLNNVMQQGQVVRLGIALSKLEAAIAETE